MREVYCSECGKPVMQAGSFIRHKDGSLLCTVGFVTLRGSRPHSKNRGRLKPPVAQR